MKKCISLLILNTFLLTAFSQVKPVEYESDITALKSKKPKLLTGYLPVSEDANSIKDAIYADPKSSPTERSNDLLRRMTFEEKLAITTGVKEFNLAGVPRLGIRSVTLADASQGLRMETVSVSGKSTSLPGMLPLASTWNNELAQEFGKTMGEECRALGVDILLGPGVNMQRLSVGGRNFEYMGEDPLLTAGIATGYIKGLQSMKITPTAKHFVANDLEFVRHIANSLVDERSLREIYLRPWEAIIKNAGCMGIMTGNNIVNGVPCVMNKTLITGILRKEFGFNGIAMSDWQNTCYFPEKQNLLLESGESLLMPNNNAFATWLRNEIKNDPSKKAIYEKQLEKMIFPNLYTFFKMGVYDRKPQDPEYLKSYEKHQQFAAKVAEEAIVLLKNEDNILPINKNKTIILLGESELFSGTGSGYVIGFDHVSYEQGLKNYYGDKFTAAKTIEEIGEDAIKKADVILFNFNKESGEAHDIPFNQPKEVIIQLKKLIASNSNVVVLMNAANAMPTDWLKDVKGLFWCSFLGQERGTALSKIISGKISPSGKLPFTFEQDFKDSPAPEFNYIGGQPFWEGGNEYKPYWLGLESEFKPIFTNNIKPHQLIDVPYSEGVFMGYRWYDAKKKPVVFPFGFGLSYTNFIYKDLQCINNWNKSKMVTVKFKVSNTGKMDAKEVVQLYVSDKESSVPRPLKELKAYRKIAIKAGETEEVTFELDKDAFAFWSVKRHDWVVEKGKFEIMVGPSSNVKNLTSKMIEIK